MDLFTFLVAMLVAVGGTCFGVGLAAGRAWQRAEDAAPAAARPAPSGAGLATVHPMRRRPSTPVHVRPLPARPRLYDQAAVERGPA